MSKPKILVSDLDGTLIPLPKVEQNFQDLVIIKELREVHRFDLVFATGRHFESVLNAIDQYDLPEPDWIICEVGTMICQRIDGSFQTVFDYQKQLEEICQGVTRDKIVKSLEALDGLQLQPEENQTDFKISYWCDRKELNKLVVQINEIQERESFPYRCLGSFDPFGDLGLIDILPAEVNKAYALNWLANFLEESLDAFVYAGDSGNDIAALVAGFYSILVGNATDHLRSEIAALLEEKGLHNRCYFAKGLATSGVLEGIRRHRLIG